MGRVLGALGLAAVLLVCGVVVGVASIAVHQWWPMLVLAAVTVVAVLVALPRRWWSRPPFVAGFAVVVSLAMLPRPEGDYLISSDLSGYALLGLTLVLVVTTVATLPRPRPRTARTDSLR